MHNKEMEKRKNKLRLNKRIKTEYETASYVKCMMPLNHESVYAKFRCGVAIRIETCRYERLAAEGRRLF